MQYRPTGINELRTPVELLIPTGVESHNGVRKFTYPGTGIRIFVNWKAYGGTETTVNGVMTIYDTAIITTWYRPDITASCRLRRTDGAVFRILAEPENIEMGNRYLSFKVQRLAGGE
jgi:hypothetical protein